MIKILNSIIIYFIECPQVFCQLVASCRQGPHTAQRKKKIKITNREPHLQGYTLGERRGGGLQS